MDIAARLRGLGLAQCEPGFRENAIDSAVLPNLTAEDLKDLGVLLVGHRVGCSMTISTRLLIGPARAKSGAVRCAVVNSGVKPPGQSLSSMPFSAHHSRSAASSALFEKSYQRSSAPRRVNRSL